MNEKQSQVIVTFEEVLQSDFWWQELNITIQMMLAQRRERTPPPGFHFKKDVVDAMHRDEHFTPEFINSHIRQVWEKKSGLPSSVRGVVLYVGNESFRKAAKKVMENKKNATAPQPIKKRTSNGNKKTAKSVGTTQRPTTKNPATNQGS